MAMMPDPSDIHMQAFGIGAEHKERKPCTTLFSHWPDAHIPGCIYSCQAAKLSLAPQLMTLNKPRKPADLLPSTQVGQSLGVLREEQRLSRHGELLRFPAPQL